MTASVLEHLYARGPESAESLFALVDGAQSPLLEPEVRASCEDELLRVYHRALREHGVSGYSLDQVRYDYRLSMLTHLQKLVRGFASFDIVNDRHQRLTKIARRRVSSAVVDNFGDDLFN